MNGVPVPFLQIAKKRWHLLDKEMWKDRCRISSDSRNEKVPTNNLKHPQE